MKIQHGYSKEPLYRRWIAMRERCNNPNRIGYHKHGGRGIKCCSAWDSYPAFRTWALEHGWSPELELDRKDNDGDYTPKNCRFVTNKINSRNRRGVISEDMAIAMKQLFRDGWRACHVARHFNVNWNTADKIKHNKTWKDIC